jgi:hypothetical protein
MYKITLLAIIAVFDSLNSIDRLYLCMEAASPFGVRATTSEGRRLSFGIKRRRKPKRRKINQAGLITPEPFRYYALRYPIPKRCRPAVGSALQKRCRRIEGTQPAIGRGLLECSTNDRREAAELWNKTQAKAKTPKN